MVKSKVVYYKNNEVVKVWRGNYSSSDLGKEYGARNIYNNDVSRLLNNEILNYDSIALYKRNRSGVKMKLINKFEIHLNENDTDRMINQLNEIRDLK